jgi:hypothetical protein
MSKPKTSFQIMTSVLKDYEPTVEEKRKINGFFFCRFLSNHPKSIYLASVFNRYYKEIPIEVQYDIAKMLLSQYRIKFIQFPKKETEESDIIKNICRYYNVSFDTAKEYFALMDDKEKMRFKNLYREGME